MSTDIAVHVPKSDCKFKQNDKKENIVLVLNHLVFQVQRIVRLHAIPASHTYVILIYHVTR